MGGIDGSFRSCLLRAAGVRRRHRSCIPHECRRAFGCAAHADIGILGAAHRRSIPGTGVPDRHPLRRRDRASGRGDGQRPGRFEGRGAMRGRVLRVDRVRDRGLRCADRERPTGVRACPLRVRPLHQLRLAHIPPGGGVRSHSGRVAQRNPDVPGRRCVRHGGRVAQQVARHVDRRDGVPRRMGTGRGTRAARSAARHLLRDERLRPRSRTVLRLRTLLVGLRGAPRAGDPRVDLSRWVR